MKSKNTKQSDSKKPWKIMGIVAIALVAMFATYVVVTESFKFKPNYAEEAAKPIEKALVDAGGKKIKSGGDGGYGADNTSPGYTSLFSIPMSENATTALVSKISSENGYNLKEATKEDKGPLNRIADQYIQGVYYDFTSKNSNVSALNAGKIEYWVDINKNNADTDPNVTTVQLDFTLPSFKNR